MDGPPAPGAASSGALTPRDDGMVMPPEWAPHERTLIAWPPADGRWREGLEAARAEYAAVARAVAAFEPVLVIAEPGQAEAVRDRCGADVEVLELPLDDAWLRDVGPIFLLGPGGDRAAADFKFNGWGRRAAAFERDAQVAERVCAALGITRYPIPMVLEGGAITVDGLGTLIATEASLLHTSRNPALEREQVEARLRTALGVERIIWLGAGLVEDTRTDGHVDGICTYVGPGRVLLSGAAAGSPNAEALADARERLEAALDARGQHVELVELPPAPGPAAPYVAVHQVNGAVIVPLAGTDVDVDAEALARIAGACPDREVVGVATPTLAVGGGAPHRVALGLPAPRPSS